MDFLVLANSYKNSNRCVAGIDLANGTWLRPLGSGPGGSLLIREFTFESGREARLLDVARIEVLDQAPENYQPENVLTTYPWAFDREATAADMKIARASASNGPELLRGDSDRVQREDFVAHPAERSLSLIHPIGVIWKAVRHNDKLRPRVAFYFDDHRYELAVTDPILGEQIRALGDGEFPLKDVSLGFSRNGIRFTVSLGEPFARDNCCYKLVAGAYDL
jgi:hypothetical protein